MFKQVLLAAALSTAISAHAIDYTNLPAPNDCGRISTPRV